MSYDGTGSVLKRLHLDTHEPMKHSCTSMVISTYGINYSLSTYFQSHP